MKRNRGAKKIGSAYAWDAITVTPLTTGLVNCKYLPSQCMEKMSTIFYEMIAVTTVTSLMQ